ncbi:MAG TPA: DNA repair protein RecO [Bdellovibrionales bacterium]|nr:DNA repair protein RecO [Bdellovibrionales bacterium]
MQVKEKLFILRKTRYGDTDLILSCLTAQGARISLIARGAVKSRKRFGGGVLEPTHYVLAVYEDKSSKSSSENPLHTLKEASLLNAFEGLRTDYSRIEIGLQFVQLINDVVREGEIDSSELFNLLGNALKAAETSQNLENLKLHFDVKLLASQGVLPLEGDEQRFMSEPIAKHETIEIGPPAAAELRRKIRRVLAEYLGRTM